MNTKKILSIIYLSFLSLVYTYAQRIQPRHATIDCGQVVYRKPITIEFELTNTGGNTLLLKDVKTSCECVVVNFPKVGIPPKGIFRVGVNYNANQMGHFIKQVRIFSNARKKPLTLTLKGNVVREITDFKGKYPYKIGDFIVEKNNIEFDDVNRGDRPYQRIHIKNISENNVQPVVMHMPAYLSAEVSPSSIAPGHSGILTLHIDSRKIHDFGLKQTNVYLGSFPGDKVASNKEISVSAVILPEFDNLTDAQRDNAPHIELSAQSFELGDFQGKKTKKGEIIIQNTGKSTLKIRSLQMFTIGTEVALNKTHIKPGEKAKLKVKAIEKTIRHARSKPRVLIITNDPDRSKITIDINVK